MPRLAIILVGCFMGCSSPVPQQQAEDQHAATPIPHPRRTIPELIRDIGKDGLTGHGDHTPAGDELVEIGEPAIPALLEVMLSDNENDRDCAERVLYEITAMKHGWQSGAWSVTQQEKCREFWDSLGSLRADDPLEKRTASVKLWRKWLATKQCQP